MNSNPSVLSIILLAAFWICPQIPAAPGYAAGELLVKWQDEPESYAAAVGNAQIGSTVKRNFGQIGWQHVQLPQGMSVPDGIDAYQALGAVLAVEPNRVVRVEPPSAASTSEATRPISRHSVTPNDPRYGSQWYLQTISAPAAWSTTTGSSNIVVAVLDTGINYKHEDLAANMWRNPGETGIDANGNDKATNGIDDDGNGFVDDVYGIDTARDALGNDSDPFDQGSNVGGLWVYHGSLCAGLIGAVGNNGQGIVGVDWSVQLMAVRVTSTSDVDSIADVIAGFEYVVLMKRRGVNIRVTSNSYGTDPLTVYSQALKEAIDAAGNEGILNVYAAGNLNTDLDPVPRYPARYDSPSLIVVAASDRSDNLASVSYYGRTGVDLAAPGVDITSTFGPATNAYASGYRGTSFACPLVSGTAALLLAANPNLTVDQLKSALFGSVDQPAGLKGKVLTNGRLNVARALEYLTNANPPSIVIFTSPSGPRTPTDAPIRVRFNRAMNRASVESSLVIDPPVSGTFEWTEDSRSFSLHHATPFDSTTSYTVRILGTAQDVVGGTLDGNFNRAREGSPAEDFVWTFRFPISNDDLANAQWVSGASGSTTSSNRYASLELDEPNHAVSPNIGASVWYRWTPPEPGGWFTFDLTSETAFDSLLAVYTGDWLDSLVAVASNDNYGSGQNSRCSFEALAGTNYSVVVAGKSAFNPTQAGHFKLSWYPTPPPGFTGSRFFPAIGVPGTSVTLTGTNFTGATSVLFNGASAGFTNAPTNNLDLRITAVVPPDATSGPITIVTPHVNVTSTTLFQVLPPPLTVRLSGANQLEIAWPATGTAFVLEVSHDLSSASWTPVTQAPARANGVTKLTLSASAGNRFYRLYEFRVSAKTRLPLTVDGTSAFIPLE